ncbi:hypothetical protein [Sphingomonas melonis]|uniref:Uncharacterized protein n=1 Tax=Sphingomonas melonis TaxID=152682 RepID=A0A7Y9FKW1_9SPHN|nr:hypothetical protein [Sphingomonas melonis]NYD88777.1 hypothetical protein [Sphingomonas melonis]
MTAMRPAPDDLEIYAATETMDQMRRRYRASKKTICIWMKSKGIVRQPHRGGNAPKAMPADFPQHYRESLRLLHVRYPGVGDGTFTRWRQELGGLNLVPPPSDFAEKWAEKTNAALCGHYRRGWNTIARWSKELGLVRPVRLPAPRAVPARKKRVTVDFVRSARERSGPPPQRPNAYQAATMTRAIRDMSPAGQAADYLRRFGPVVRCDERGRYNENGTHWRRGSTVLTAADVIARAEFNGWRADQWAMVA